jgi:hypothetical protein
MEYFFEFHWWYVLVGLIIIAGLTGKGGRVVKMYSADLKILDERFKNCMPKAEYKIFKEGQPDKIDIEVENLPLKIDETLDVLINGALLSRISVKIGKEAKYEHWSDEAYFPQIKKGDVVVINYFGKKFLEGTFEAS